MGVSAVTVTSPTGSPVVTRDSIQAHIEGDISGQVAFGSGNIQVGSVHGGVVNIGGPGEAPVPRLRPVPIRRGLRTLPDEVLGRENELDRAIGALRQGRPVGVHGEPGVGKTTLLMLVADHASLPTPDRVVYKRAKRVPVADLLQLLFDTFFDCDVRYKPSEGQIREHLASVEAVAVLDDVNLDRDDVEELLGSAPECMFIVASTERVLWGAATALSLQGLPEEAGLALIARELGRAMSDDELPQALALHRALNGHALRMLQAASLVRDEGASFAALAAELPAASGLMPQPVRAVLDGAQRDLLGLLAAHAETPLHVDHIIDLTGRSDAPTVLQSLQQLQLVKAHSPSYSVTIPLNTNESEALGVDEWSDRAVDYWTGWAARHAHQPDRIAGEIEILQVATELSAAKGRWRDTLALVRSIDPAIILSRQWGRWKTFLNSGLAAARKGGDRSGEAWSLHQLGVRALCLGHDREAETHLRQALDIRRSLGDTAGSEVTRYHLDLLQPRPPLPPRGTRRGVRWGPFLLGGLALLLGIVGLALSPFGLDDPGDSAGDLSIAVRPGRLIFDPASLIRVVEVHNRGDEPVAVHGVTIEGGRSGDFAVASETCSAASIPGQASCSVAVRFLSSASVPPARLVIANSSGRPAAVMLVFRDGGGPSGEDPPVVPVPDTTVPDPPPNPLASLTAEPAALQFGTQPVGTSAAPLRLSIRAGGAGVLSLAQMAVTGANAEEFALVDDRCSGARLDPGTACTAAVRFTPRQQGSRAALLSVEYRGSGGTLRVPVAGAGVPGAGPDLISASGDKASGVVTYQFDSVLSSDSVQPDNFHIYTATGSQLNPTSVSVAGSAVTARYTASQVVESTVATVEEGAVTDTQRQPNPVCDAPLHPVAPVAGATTAPDLLAVRLGAGATGAQVLFFDFDQPVNLAVAPGAGFEVIDADNIAYEALGTVSAGETTIGATFSFPYSARPLVRGVAEAGSVVASGVSPVSNPLQSVGIGPAGTANMTTGPDLVGVDVVRPQVVRFTFDAAVVAPLPQAFRVYGADAVEQSAAAAAPVVGSPSSVDVSFSPTGPVPVASAVGASLTEGGVAANFVSGVTALLVSADTAPTPPQTAGKASLPLRARSFEAGRTTLPDLIAVTRGTVAGRQTLSFTFDQPISAGSQASPTTRIALSLYRPGGRRIVATGAAVVQDGGSRIVLTDANFGDSGAVADAVQGSVNDVSATPPEIPEGCSPVS